jgi:hypothetical protein
MVFVFALMVSISPQSLKLLALKSYPLAHDGDDGDDDKILSKFQSLE